MKPEILYPKVVVYRDGIENPDKLINNIKNSSHWQPWYDVGEQYNMPVTAQEAQEFATLPTFEEIKVWISNLDRQDLVQEIDMENIYRAFIGALSNYLTRFPIEYKNLYIKGLDILRYRPKLSTELTLAAGGNEHFALPFHTDRDPRTEDQPGCKPLLTITMYLNDDYEGGDIHYAVFNGTYNDFSTSENNLIPNEGYVLQDSFAYKPKAGDVIIFPSGIPFYHGVHKVTKGQKYVIRCHFNQNHY